MLNSEIRRGYALISPALILICGMLVLPMIGLIALSVTTDRQLSSFTLDNYSRIFALRLSAPGSVLPFALDNPIYLYLLAKSLAMSLLSTSAVLLLAYPAAFYVAFRVAKNRTLWLFIISLPFMTSYLLRVFAWRLILGHNGLVNSALLAIGVIDAPLDFLVYSNFAVVLTLAHAWAAFAILPIYVSLRKIDRSLVEASIDLGSGPSRTFWRIIFPLSLPGVISAAVLVFIPTVGDYVTPALVGGTNGTMIGSLVYALFTRADQPNLGAAVSVTMIVATVFATIGVTQVLRHCARRV